MLVRIVVLRIRRWCVALIRLIYVAEKSIGDCCDVISNNSSGIGTANSDFTESNFSIKANDTANSSGSSSGKVGLHISLG